MEILNNNTNNFSSHVVLLQTIPSDRLLESVEDWIGSAIGAEFSDIPCGVQYYIQDDNFDCC